MQVDYICNKNYKIFIIKLLLRVLDRGMFIEYMYVFDFQDWNLYGLYFVYMNVERDGNVNMVFFRNSNGMGRLLYFKILIFFVF